MKNFTDEFVNALLGECVTEKIPLEYDLYAPLIGDWDFDYYDTREDRSTRHVEGEWIFRRILEGAGIEDLFICPSRATRESNPQPDGEYGVAIRMYNPNHHGYDMAYACNGFMTRLEVHGENGKIVCTIKDQPREKWVFSEITENTFHWQNGTLLESGEFEAHCDIYARRKQAL